MQQCIKILLFLILNEAQHVSGDTPSIVRSLKLYKQPLDLHTVEGCRTYCCWTLSGNIQGCRTCCCRTLSGNVCYLTRSNNSTSDNLPRMQMQRMLVQF